VQTIIPLSGSDAVKLTTAVYLTPSGHSVEGGIVPDHVVPMDDKAKDDVQLRSAKALLTGQTVAAPPNVTVR